MTVEEVIKNIKTILDEAIETYDDECDSSVCYITSNNAKSLEIAIELLKKQIPMKVIGNYDYNSRWSDKCPKCNTYLDYDNKYCPECGQVIDWEEGD